MPHIATDEFLLDHAVGASSPPVGLLLATHIALNPAARRRYRDFETLGGAMLDRIDPVAVAPDAFERLMARIDAPRGRPDPMMAPAPAVEGTGGDVAELPAPLRGHVAGGIDALPWRQVTRGVHEAALPLAGRGGERATLLRIAAGRAIPRHTHRGNEMTLVLDGDFADEGGHYGRGDLSITDPTIEHQPVAGQGRDCLCLVVTSAPIRLTGPLMRLLNPFLPR
jgi:putative transcriptional regulator